MQVSSTSRILGTLTGTPDRPLIVRSMPAGGIPVPDGGDVMVTPEGWAVLNADGSAYCFIGSNGVVVGRYKPAEGDSPS